MRKKKKHYQKPELAQIDLKSEEVFLTACKLNSGNFTTRTRTFACSASTRCSTTRSAT